MPVTEMGKSRGWREIGWEAEAGIRCFLVLLFHFWS